MLDWENTGVETCWEGLVRSFVLQVILSLKEEEKRVPVFKGFTSFHTSQIKQPIFVLLICGRPAIVLSPVSRAGPLCDYRVSRPRPYLQHHLPIHNQHPPADLYLNSNNNIPRYLILLGTYPSAYPATPSQDLSDYNLELLVDLSV